MLKRILIAGALALVLALGVVGYSFFKTPEAASEPIAAIPLTVSTPTVGTPDSPGATSPPSAPAAPATTAPAPPSASATIFEIQQAESTASFTIDEVLEGAPKTVVGTTNQVAGQIAVNPADPAATQLGVIQINARTLETDSGSRNRAIKNRILMTDEFELITFTPTQLIGLPATGAVGQSYSFQVVGDLTIKGVTQPVTFDVSVTATSEQRLEGSATSTITYADFGVAIPSVPMVASVSDEVLLELRFVAAPSS